MGANLMFEAGRLAEKRGWSSAEVVEADAIASVPPGRGEVIVVTEGAFSVQHAREVAALSASGKEVAVITSVTLADDVQAWLPEGCTHLAGEPLGAGWSVSKGLVTLTPEGEDVVWDEVILAGISTAEAAHLAEAVARVKVGVAWDRPIFVPATHLCDWGILNIDGYSKPPIRGLRADEYLRFEDDEVTGMWRTDSNPLNILGWTGQNYIEFNAVLTLNVSIGGSPVLLVCGPYFASQGKYDYSSCIVREREHNLSGFKSRRSNDPRLASLQALPRTQQDDLAPLPTWLSSLPAESRDVVLRLLDEWASGFFRGLVAGGIEWFCRHGKDLDSALQVDWQTLTDELARREH